MQHLLQTHHARSKNIVTAAINAAAEGAASKSPLEQSIFKPEPSNERHVSAGINASTDVPVQSEFVYTFDWIFVPSLFSFSTQETIWKPPSGSQLPSVFDGSWIHSQAFD